jgi:[protein-PII] uridylyltransferase
MLERVRKREARASHRTDAAPPYLEVVPGASGSAAVIEVRTGDRSGLLFALGRALSERRLSIRSAHISTLAGQAIDTFYITEPDGSIPSPDRTAEARQALADAAAGISRNDH